MVDPATAGAVTAVAGSAAAIVRSKAVTAITKASLNATYRLWSTLVAPVAKEFGLSARDSARAWRQGNTVNTTTKMQQKFDAAGVRPADVRVHPRLGIAVFEQSSWTDDEVLQDMWAGLLVSSTADGAPDDSNMIFVDLLSKMTSSQARVFRHTCENVEAVLDPTGIVHVPIHHSLSVSIEELQAIAGVSDFLRLDRELDHMRAIGIMEERTGFPLDQHVRLERDKGRAGLKPSTLGLQLYAYCNGARDVVAFYDAKPAG
jgi:hypothetical protein